jgi:hypothetical protein
MAVKKTAGRIWLEATKALREQGVVNIDLPTGLRKAIEDRRGKPLTDAEAIRGEVDRVDNRPAAERFADEHFVVKLKADAPKSGADLYLLEAERSLREERLERMTTAERRVEFAREEVAKQQAEAIAAKAHEEFLATHAATIKKLQDLRTDLRFDDSWDFADARRVDRALQAFNTPNVDPAFALELANSVFGVQQQKITTAAQALIAKRLELEGQIAELQEQLPADDPAPAPAPEAKGFDAARLEKLGAVLDSFSKLSASAVHADAETEGGEG